mgnify:CR=1 FL=1
MKFNATVYALWASMICLSGGIAGCDAPPDPVEPAEEDRSPAEREAMEQDLIDLAELEGEDIDELRRALPVAVVPIDLHPDGTLAASRVDFTMPKVPAEFLGDYVRAIGVEEGAPLAVDDPLSSRTVFGPDNRYVFYDTSYPFSTTGKIETQKGVCAGTMVGPRHVLTASHCIQWNGDNTTGWVRFRPMAYDNLSPFGEAWGTLTYSYRKVPGPGLTNSEVAFDFVVVVLDRYMGNSTGYMGSQTYTTGWNNGAYWANVGYPGAVGGGTRPAFQNGCSITSAVNQCWSSWCSLQLLSQCDSTPGNSGGPLWANFNGGPGVVAVASAEDPSTNHYAGGSLLPTMINHARNNSP